MRTDGAQDDRGNKDNHNQNDNDDDGLRHVRNDSGRLLGCVIYGKTALKRHIWMIVQFCSVCDDVPEGVENAVNVENQLKKGEVNERCILSKVMVMHDIWRYNV